MKPRVLVTRHVYPQAIAILQEQCVVDYRDSHDVMDEATLVKKLQHADGVVCQLTDKLSGVVGGRGVSRRGSGAAMGVVAAASAAGVVRV